MARLYGTGSLWLRKSKKHPEGEYWVRYCVGSRRITENSNFCLCHDSRAESQATRFLAGRIGKSEAGVIASPRARRTLVDDLSEAYLKARKVALLQKIPENLPAPTRAWREANAEELLAGAKRRWDLHLTPIFGHRKAAFITTADLEDYIVKRHDAGAKNGTINRELAALRKAFQIGYDTRPRLVADIPSFPKKLPESARTGYIEDDVFDKLLPAIQEPGLRALVLCAYRLGFRKAELKNLLVMQVAGGWISLFAGTTKNAKARKVAMPPDVRAAVETCCKMKAPDEYVFTWPSGKPIRDFRTAWSNACKAAGVPDLYIHDLRRSFVRRSQRKGIPATTAMRISGHLTRQVFDDYDVVAENDLLDAADKL
jgi:integrase